ncbi:MAG: hypothetical protein AAB113_05615, partial [Candidatus Eisenbacteria bacterium]
MQVRFMMRGAQRRLERYLAAKRAKSRPVSWRPGSAPGAGLGRQPAVTSEPPDPAGFSPRGVAAAEAPASTT